LFLAFDRQSGQNSILTTPAPAWRKGPSYVEGFVSTEGIWARKSLFIPKHRPILAPIFMF
jgi:hypothetical protein